MNTQSLRELLQSVRAGERSVEEALARLRNLPFEDLGFAKIDHHRALRCGFPEVIFCQGKSPEQVAAIFDRCAANHPNVLATRASEAMYDVVKRLQPEARHHETAHMITLRRSNSNPSAKRIAIVSAGTSNLPIAEQARITAEMLDQSTHCLYDVGVAGIHRLLAHREVLQSCNAAVVVAGMEGALASVVGGLVDYPVIAVPTSVGYGASFHGLAALLAMLNSCAPNVLTVNIDNGFGAGYAAALINRRSHLGSDGGQNGG